MGHRRGVLQHRADPAPLHEQRQPELVTPGQPQRGSLPGLAFGMVTFGVLSNAPAAVTEVSAPAEAAAGDEDDPEEADFDDDPQPARTTQASKGMAISARKRRMKTSMWWMSAPSAYWHDCAPASLRRVPLQLISRLRRHNVTCRR